MPFPFTLISYRASYTDGYCHGGSEFSIEFFDDRPKLCERIADQLFERDEHEFSFLIFEGTTFPQGHRRDPEARFNWRGEESLGSIEVLVDANWDLERAEEEQLALDATAKKLEEEIKAEVSTHLKSRSEARDAAVLKMRDETAAREEAAERAKYEKLKAKYEGSTQ